jgi:branched-subunit amino acid aminotransferase/4-amino-4-deoxychorismate lyase
MHAVLTSAQHASAVVVLLLRCRPDRNAARCAAGAERLSMPPLPHEQFVQAVADTVRANAGALQGMSCLLLAGLVRTAG